MDSTDHQSAYVEGQGAELGRLRNEFLNLLADAHEWVEQPDGDVDSNGRMIDCTTYKLIVSAHSLQNFCEAIGIEQKHQEGLMDALDRYIGAAFNEPDGDDYADRAEWQARR